MPLVGDVGLGGDQAAYDWTNESLNDKAETRN